MRVMHATVVATIVLVACGACASPVAVRETAPPSAVSVLETAALPSTAEPAPTARPTGTRPIGTTTPSPPAASEPAPARPTGVVFRTLEQVEPSVSEQDDEDEAEAFYTTTYEVSWETPQTDGVEIRVWAITECLSEPADPKPGTSGPCLVKGTRIPKSAKTLIASAPASEGGVRWTWRSWGGCDIYEYVENADAPEGKGMVFSIVVGAYGPSGQSVFAIAYPGAWAIPGQDEMPC